MTTVLMVEDHALLLECLCSLLKTDDHVKIVGKARNGCEAVMIAETAERGQALGIGVIWSFLYSAGSG